MSTKIDFDSLHSKYFLPMFSTINEITASDITYTAENFLNTLINRDPNGSLRTDTTPTASQIISRIKEINPESSINTSIYTYIYNSGTYNITLSPGLNVQLYGTMLINPEQTALFLVKIQDDTPSSEKVEIYRNQLFYTYMDVSKIIDGTYYNPIDSTNLWTNKNSIIFQQNFIYYIKGSYTLPADNTDTSVTNILGVLTQMNSGFFQNDGDKLRFSINWKDYADGRLIIQFTNANTYNGGNREVITFGSLRINTNTTQESYTISWIGYNNNNDSVTLYSTNLVSDIRNLLDASKINDNQPVIFEIIRLNNAQLTIKWYNYEMIPVTSQADLTCNLPTSTFNKPNVTVANGETNNDNIFVDDINYFYISEVSDSEINVSVQYIPN